MKNKKILAVGLCGAICLSLAGFTYANALASDAPKNLVSETENTSGVDILYHDTDGGQISTDCKNWISEADYEKSNAAPDVPVVDSRRVRGVDERAEKRNGSVDWNRRWLV